RMYQRYWGFKFAPFRNTHDPVWYYSSPAHEEALARLLYVIEQNHQLGWLYGPSGTGKSFLLNVLLDQLKRAAYHTTYLDVAGVDAEELIWKLSAHWQIAPSLGESVRHLWRRVQDQLDAWQFSAEPGVILLDHFDRADSSCLAYVDRLLQLRSSAAPSCTLILAVERLGFSDQLPASKLKHRAADHFDLEIAATGIEEDEVSDYIESRLRIAGSRKNPFGVDAVSEIASISDGNPARINQLCELSLLAAMGNGLTLIEDDLVVSVAEELMHARRSDAARKHFAATAASHRRASEDKGGHSPPYAGF
ncbi:MAG: ExeA family protein, partial [Planctomycetaceae bacterium]